MEIRIETANDHTAVRGLHLESFPGPDEACLVDRLREDGDAILSLVAVEGDTIVGHIMLSRMIAPFPALGLAPIAVQLGWRRKGIAARLIEEGIARARCDGWVCIFVLGDPDYYRRFGFSATLAGGFDCAYAGPYLMALSLPGNGFPSTSGHVGYAPAFSALGEGEPPTGE